MNELLPNRPEVETSYAGIAARRGDGQRARELLAPVEALPAPIRPDSNIARVYAALGDLEACFRWLDMAIEDHKFPPRVWRWEPGLESVRRDPRFGVLLRRLGLG